MIERFAGRFALLRPLGQGGMGEVFFARDLTTGAECAIKRLRPRLDGDGSESLKREFEALTRIRHPAVVTVSEYGFAPDGSPFLVLEYVPGLTADRVIARGDWRTLCSVAAEVAHGLEALHAAGVVHGDVKPSNILVVGRAGAPASFADVRLLDFGLAALRGRDESGHRGTAGFAAPEVVLGAAPTPASDLYGLGVSLFALLTGAAPFEGEGADAQLRSQQAGPPSARRLEDAATPWPLIELVMRLMAPVPGERPDSARAVRHEIERILPEARRTLADRLRATVVVGREKELSRLEQWLAGAPQPPALAVITGEAGAGKSALLGELASRAGVRGQSVFQISCASLETPGAAAQAVSRMLAARRGSAESARSGETALRLLPADARLQDADVGPLAEAAALWAHEGASEGTLLVLLDDAERLDPLSSAWLRRVALHPSAPNVRWVLARRTSGETSDERERVLLDAGLALGLSLGPLGRDDVERLAAARLHAPVPPELLEFLARHGGGHPGLTVELLHAAAARGAIEEIEAGVRLHPEALEGAAGATDFERSLLARLISMDAPVRAALEALAACGTALSPGELRRLAPESSDETIARLHETGLVSRMDDGRLLLRPPSLGERVLAGLPAPRREALHRAAQALPNLPARRRFRHARALGDVAAALHEATLAFAEDPDPRLAAEAAALAEAGDPVAAAGWQERAAMRWRARGRYADAIPHLKRSLELDREGPARGDRWVLLSTAALRAGAPRDVMGVVQQALDEPLADDARSLLMVNRAAAHGMLGDAALGERDAREALTLGEGSGDPVAVGNAAEVLARFLIDRGALDEAESFATRAAEAYRNAHHQHGIVRSMGARGAIARLRFRLDEAEQLLCEAIAAARGLENRLALSEQLIYLSIVLVEAGRWNPAREASAEAARIAIEDGRPSEAAAAIANLAQIEGLLGRARSARRRARLAIRLCRRFRPELNSYAWRSHAQAERLLGRLRRAEHAARRALELAPGAESEDAQWSRLELGRALAARGMWNEAAALWDGSPAAGTPPVSLAGALLALWSGRAALRRADLATGEARFAAAEAWIRARPAPLAAAQLQVLRAELAFGKGLTADATESGRRALEALAALPAPAERARAALDLSRLAPVADEARPVVTEWLDLAARGFERAGDHRSREQALSLAVEWLRRPAPVAVNMRESGLIDRVSWLLHSLTDLGELTKRAMQAAVDQMDAERGVLLLADPETGQLVPMAEHGAVEAATRREAVSYSRRVVQRVSESGASLVIEDAPVDPRAASESVANLRLRSILCVPMFLAGKTVGAVYLDDSRRPHAFGDAERGLLEGFAHLMAVAIDRGRRHEEVRRENELLEGENLSLRLEVGARIRSQGLIGSSAPMKRVLAMVEHAARTNTTVLITGENGTGKELLARTLHHSGQRRLKPFVNINCGAIPESLLESELFGILSNVATGVRARPGRFLQAHGGTLFLDEIGEMPPQQQVALLSAIATREITPVGGGKPVAVDVRIIAASNRDLRRLVDSGQFRQDLYYRLNVIELELPPLRERKADVPALVHHFVKAFARDQAREEPALSPDFLAVLMQSDWPGNVRELQNYIERIMAMTPGPVLRPEPPPRDLERRGDAIRQVRGKRLPDARHEVQIRMIREALARTRGNQSKAARELGITEQAVRYWLRKYGIPLARENQRIRRNPRTLH